MTHFNNAATGPRPHASAPLRGNAGASDGTSGHTKAAPLRQLYLALSNGGPDGEALAGAADWLTAQLTAAQIGAASGARAPALPSEGARFAAWHAARQDDIDEHYKQYVAERRAGAPRRLFSGRAHALHYLSAVAPARLTDGAWLYGVLARWDDPAVRPLVTTYLEELGNGVPDKNHVVIFQQLIDAHGCASWQQLDDHHFHSGLTQLALAHHADRFLPELVGYNLGNEFASLDTLIAAYELNELGIDPYYFTLHASVDNSASGHAMLALDALHKLTEKADNGADFLHRVDAGFHLHARAPGNAVLLAGFALERELHAALDGKHVPATGADGAPHPAQAVLVGGRSLGDWLAHPGQAPALLEALAGEGWIVRGGDPAASRLWALIEANGHEQQEPAEAAPLAGLFSGYELALLADWIATDPQGAAASHAAAVNAARRAGAFHTSGQAAPRRIEESAARGIIRHRFPDDEHGWEAIASELSLLEARVVASASKEEAIALLGALMAPSNHHTSTGLMATRMFSKLFAA